MIDIEGLGFRYPGADVDTLHDITLQVPAGSVFGLLGPNGAGKSTLLNILTGLLPCRKGSVTINGLSLPGDAAAIKHFLALVPQDFAFYPQLTGVENLRFFARVLGLSGPAVQSAVGRCLAVAQLEKHADKRAGLYSGGLKRRLNLAIGLLSEPKLIFLDEPTVGVDAQSRHFLLQSIRELAQQGTTVVYTSHYMEEIQLICDRLAIIDHGAIRLAGTLDDLLHNSHRVLSIALQAPASAEQQAAFAKQWPNAQWDTHRQRLSLDDADPAGVSTMLAQLEAWQLPPDSIDYGRKSRLEDVFLDVTQRQLRD